MEIALLVPKKLIASLVILPIFRIVCFAKMDTMLLQDLVPHAQLVVQSAQASIIAHRLNQGTTYSLILMDLIMGKQLPAFHHAEPARLIPISV
jgi:hypothetical protein